MREITGRVKATYENPCTGLRTFEVPADLEALLSERLGRPLMEVARRARRNKRGLLTFKGGLGYNVMDKDLLGGNGDGRTARALNVYVSYR